MEKLKLTQEGLNNLKKNLAELEEELRNLGKYKGQAAANEGDAWHDNFAFEQTENKERALLYQINQLRRQIGEAEIIEANNNDSSTVGIGSKVKVSLTFSDGETEENNLQITGEYGKTKRGEISVNSPLGKCIMGKCVGFEGEYFVGENKIGVKVLSIEK